MNVEKEINFVPVENTIEYKKLFKIVVIPTGVLVLLIVFLFAFLLPQRQISSLKQENVRLLGEIASIGEIDKNLKNYEDKQAELKSKVAVMTAIESEKVKVLDFVEKLSAYLPGNVNISTLSINNGNSFEIGFITNSPIDNAKLIAKLEEMDIFESVETASMPIKDGENVVKFSLKLKGKQQVQNK